MDDPFLVRRAKSTGDLQRIVDRFALRKQPCRPDVHAALAFQQFRNDVRRAVMRADVIDDEDVRMIERAGGLRFLLETRRRSLSAERQPAEP